MEFRPFPSVLFLLLSGLFLLSCSPKEGEFYSRGNETPPPSDIDLQSLIESYPRLTPDDVRACLEYAQALVEGEDVFPAVPPPRA